MTAKRSEEITEINC